DILAFPLSHGLRDPGARNGKCRDCRYLADCRGCRSRTYSLTGDWLASDPCCPLHDESVGKKAGQ
ncbi:MAG: hypothetical protein PHU08_00505, partial [Dehalococcoidales bacterium]|nr:hypothetical protein [Dehalococcoidales bacterium]